MDIVILGLSITSAWGNGHATTYRALVKALVARGHQVLFLERDMPWYAANRDLPHPPFGETVLYGSVRELDERFAQSVSTADLAIVGSFVPEGIAVGEWAIATAQGLCAFYDIDTPVTLAALARGDCAYLSGSLISHYSLYLSFSGGPTLRALEREYGSPAARALYCAVDPDLYYPEPLPGCWDLGYMGTYSDDRQPALERLLLDPARDLPHLRFVVAGPQYPAGIAWPANVERIEHLPPAEHRAFYNAQRYTLNITRADMRAVGYSPSVRLFEAGACATPIITDTWDGLDSFFTPGDEILPVDRTGEVIDLLTHQRDPERRATGERARSRTLADHTAERRAVALEHYVRDVRGG